MPAYSEDRCSCCGAITSPELLTVKRVQFMPRTRTTKVIRSRSVAWLCGGCLAKDPDWNREAYKGSPGMTSPALNRVREDKVV